MDRRDFIKNSCVACLSASALAGVLSSCSATKYIGGVMGKDGVTITTDEFISKQKGKSVYRPYVIVRNDALLYPICVYRFGENEYTALWMRCTHQGTELQASGDRLQCPAHGSEFTNHGKISNGPADKDLRTFPVTVTHKQIFIDLRAV